MTRRGDLKLSHGATAKVRENAVKQDRVRVTNAIGHHPERSGFLRRTEFIGGTSGWDTQNTRVSAPDGVNRRDRRKTHINPFEGGKGQWLGSET